MILGSIWRKKDRERAAYFVACGQLIGVFNRGVCALWFDGGSQKAINRLLDVKGEKRLGRPIALTLSLEEFIPMVDLKNLPGGLADFLSSSDLKSKIGSLCFIRAPLKKDFHMIIPDAAKSFDEQGVCMIQNWDSFGHNPVEQLLLLIKKFGISHPGVTSMNVTGQSEIVDQKEAERFCRDFGIPIFLKDPRAHPKHVGSYTIFTFNQNGIKLERDGNIPADLFKFIFGLPIDRDDARKPRHPQLKFPISRMKKLSPSKIRQATLLFIRGEDPFKESTHV